MNWRTVRILCGVSMALIALAMALLFASHGQWLAMRVSRVLLRGAVLPLVAAGYVGIQLRRVEWKGRPAYARQLQFSGAWAPLLGVTALVAVVLLFF